MLNIFLHILAFFQERATHVLSFIRLYVLCTYRNIMFLTASTEHLEYCLHYCLALKYTLLVRLYAEISQIYSWVLFWCRYECLEQNIQTVFILCMLCRLSCTWVPAYNKQTKACVIFRCLVSGVRTLLHIEVMYGYAQGWSKSFNGFYSVQDVGCLFSDSFRVAGFNHHKQGNREHYIC